jgi:hypothetical protein
MLAVLMLMLGLLRSTFVKQFCPPVREFLRFVAMRAFTIMVIFTRIDEAANATAIMTFSKPFLQTVIIDFALD